MRSSSAFTLIELSVVLVIIGLIVGGVLVGRDLVQAAALRSTLAQIDKYNQAANTFKGKYGGLPGDLDLASATSFGFTPRGTGGGQGDGNGIIEGAGSSACGFCGTVGETAVFWMDLSYANGLKLNLIEGAFNTSNSTTQFGYPITGNAIRQIIPDAKMGGNNYIYVWSGGPTLLWNNVTSKEAGSDGNNYFGLAAVTQLGQYWQVYSSPGLTVAQASAMDSKIDDGLPQTGRVLAVLLIGDTLANFAPAWAGSGSQSGAPYTTAVSGTASTCFDNGGNASSVQQYSLGQNNGRGVNCALSFRFQ
jgi:prepilin-type N-terminal cleavage/methylation domain-containing protein